MKGMKLLAIFLMVGVVGCLQAVKRHFIYYSSKDPQLQAELDACKSDANCKLKLARRYPQKIKMVVSK